MNTVLAIVMVAVGDWSEPVDGLRGRLIVAQGRALDDGKARESLIYLEVQNVAETGERSFTFDPDGLKCELLDAKGKAVPKSPPFGAAGGRPGKTAVTLPFDSTLRLRANPYGFFRADDLLVPFSTAVWLIKAGDTADYYLAGTFTVPPVDRNGPGKAPWSGELKLPKAKLIRPAAAPKQVTPVGASGDPNPVFDGWKGLKAGTSVTIRHHVRGLHFGHLMS